MNATRWPACRRRVELRRRSCGSDSTLLAPGTRSAARNGACSRSREDLVARDRGDADLLDFQPAGDVGQPDGRVVVRPGGERQAEDAITMSPAPVMS